MTESGLAIIDHPWVSGKDAAPENDSQLLKFLVAATLKQPELMKNQTVNSGVKDEASKAARRAGAIVHGGPSSQTSVVVRGRPNKLQAAGRDAGLKLMEIKRLREKGHRITLLNEDQFWRLVGKLKARVRR